MIRFLWQQRGRPTEKTHGYFWVHALSLSLTRSLSPGTARNRRRSPRQAAADSSNLGETKAQQRSYKASIATTGLLEPSA